MTVFRHGVASGDPTADSVVLWTRVGDADGPVDVGWWVDADATGERVAEGVVTADADADHTVHVDPGGLEPDTRYRYGFSAGDDASPVGTTKTLPGPGAERLRFAMCSCAKYSAGYFNAYARIAERAERGELDFLLHLGDYIYEVSNHPPPSQTPPADIGRDYDPDHECVTVEDYRRRYAHYRSDPDVQRLHSTLPVIAAVDDHEFADGVWRDGSIEHRDDRDGPWADRRAAAFRARWDWQPYRMPDPAEPERVWRTVPLSDLADLLLIDTRSMRDEPVGSAGRMADPSRSQLGPAQRAWLLDAIAGSTATWRVLGNSSVMAPVWDPRLPPEAREAMRVLKMVNPAMDGPDGDQWDGYAAERDAILAAIEATGDRNTLVVSGDVHIGMANLLQRNPTGADARTVAAEFVTTSLTSQNVDDKKGWAPRTLSVPAERAMVEAVPYVQWVDFDSHGYVVVELTPERATGRWWFVDTVLERSDGERLAATFAVDRGTPALIPL
jgi:alkaline phosphatase D